MENPINKQGLLKFAKETIPHVNIDVARPITWDRKMNDIGIKELHYYVWVYNPGDNIGKPLHLLEFWFEHKKD